MIKTFDSDLHKILLEFFPNFNTKLKWYEALYLAQPNLSSFKNIKRKTET